LEVGRYISITSSKSSISSNKKQCWSSFPNQFKINWWMEKLQKYAKTCYSNPYSKE